VNDKDLVTRLPPKSAGFDHLSSSGLLLSADGSVSYVDKVNRSDKVAAGKVIELIKSKLSMQQVDDHSISLYCDKLNRRVGQQDFNSVLGMSADHATSRSDSCCTLCCCCKLPIFLLALLAVLPLVVIGLLFAFLLLPMRCCGSPKEGQQESCPQKFHSFWWSLAKLPYKAWSCFYGSEEHQKLTVQTPQSTRQSVV